MNGRIAGIALLALGMAAGAWFQFSRRAPEGRPAVRVAAGEASAPDSSDFAGELPSATLPPPKIPDQLPQFSLEDRSGKTIPIASFAGSP